ncbi:MAG: hypothetical protein OEM49_00865 [Myxococcales bacterium]|nr:hypothetical protein [Myxococcales bacterium]
MATRRPVFLEARDRGLRIVHRADVEPALVCQAIERHRENAAHGTRRCEAYGPGSSVSRVRVAARGGALDLAVKWNHWRGLRGVISDALRGSRAVRAHVGAEHLHAIGMLHPETLAIAERRRLGLVIESFLLTRFLEGTQPLPAVLPEIRRVPRERRELAHAIGELVGRLHAAGFDHTDLKHSNLLVTPDRRLVLIDLDALARRQRPSWRRRVRALGQLEAFASDLYPWLPRTDRARFLHGYLQHEPGLAECRRPLVRAVRAWVERRLARWARQDRRYHIQYPLAPRAAAPEAEAAGPAEPSERQGAA